MRFAHRELVEEVLGRRLDPLAAQGELDDDRIDMRERIGDGVGAGLPEALVIDANRLSYLTWMARRPKP